MNVHSTAADVNQNRCIYILYIYIYKCIKDTKPGLIVTLENWAPTGLDYPK